MTRTAAVGDGPVVFFSNGVQVEVPLSAIYFENDAVGTTRTDLTGFDKWIQFLASRNRLIAAAAPPLAKALVVKAVSPGAAGNNIQVTVTRKTDTTVDITVTETDVYEGLTLATLVRQLGSRTDPAERPGLLWVKQFPANPADPTTVTTVPPGIVAGGTATAPIWQIAGGNTTATAVTLEARTNTPATAFLASDFTVAISNIQAPAVGAPPDAKFTLTITWTRKVLDVAIGDIPARLDALGYVVSFSLPAGTTTFTKLPRPGAFNLTGGRETVTVPAGAATVTIMANE